MSIAHTKCGKSHVILLQESQKVLVLILYMPGAWLRNTFENALRCSFCLQFTCNVCIMMVHLVQLFNINGIEAYLLLDKPEDFSWLAISLLKSPRWSCIFNLFSLSTSTRHLFSKFLNPTNLSTLFRSIFLWPYPCLLINNFKYLCGNIYMLKSIHMVFPRRLVIFSTKELLPNTFKNKGNLSHTIKNSPTKYSNPRCWCNKACKQNSYRECSLFSPVSL